MRYGGNRVVSLPVTVFAALPRNNTLDDAVRHDLHDRRLDAKPHNTNLCLAVMERRYPLEVAQTVAR